jgi:hypothetical protein
VNERLVEPKGIIIIYISKISAGTGPSNPYFRSPKGTFSKALEMFFA